MENNKIAIACQGGGSQTAFTAGVLKSFFENDIHEKKQIVSLSGTSGGAICATLTWYAMIKSKQGDSLPIAQKLMKFWEDNSTQDFYEEWYNDSLVGFLRFVGAGMLPRWETSPSANYFSLMLPEITSFLPHGNFYDFQKLLKAHLDFDEIMSWNMPSSPVLLIGTADVLKGTFRKFSSLKGEITMETILASAAVPSIFPAVRVGESSYWDGLFSDNPPTDELLDKDLVGEDNFPDELWVIQINPKECRTVPTTPSDIEDRRNEMIGNQSLFHGLEKIELINRFLKEGAFTEEYHSRYRPVQIRIIEMSERMQEKLDYVTKLDRNRHSIAELIADGESQGNQFLQQIA